MNSINRREDERRLFSFLYEKFQRQKRQSGLTKKRLAQQLGKSPQYVGQLITTKEQGVIPSFEVCEELSEILKLSPTERYQLLSLQILARAPHVREVATLGTEVLSSLPPEQIQKEEWPIVTYKPLEDSNQDQKSERTPHGKDLTNTPLVKMLESVRQIPTDNNDQFLLLFGSVVALSQCQKLIENFPEYPDGYDPTKLLPDFEEALKSGEEFSWVYSKNLTVWSAGFFLNKAQSNVIAALEGCVEAWLPNEEKEHIDLYIGIRLHRLESLITGEVKEMIRVLENDLHTIYSDYQMAYRRVEKLIQECVPTWFSWEGGVPEERTRLLEELFEMIPDKLTPAACVSTLFGYSMGVQRQVRGWEVSQPDRSDMIYPIKWIMTSHSIIWIANLCKALNEAAPRQSDRKHPDRARKVLHYPASRR